MITRIFIAFIASVLLYKSESILNLFSINNSVYIKLTFYFTVLVIFSEISRKLSKFR